MGTMTLSKTSWVARNKDGSIYLWSEEPKKDIELGKWIANKKAESVKLFDLDYPEASWNNENPTKVIINKTVKSY